VRGRRPTSVRRRLSDRAHRAHFASCLWGPRPSASQRRDGSTASPTGTRQTLLWSKLLGRVRALRCIRDDSGRFGRSSTLRGFLAGTDFRPARARYFACGICAGCGKAGGRQRRRRQQNNAFCRSFTGAAGLEPATSGVTDRSWWFRDGRDFAGISGESRAFRPWLCGACQAAAGASGELLRDLCGMCSLSRGNHSTASHPFLE
jgi:hypothetical protein